jgi:transcriptional regulator with XRE-family HTH domain
MKKTKKLGSGKKLDPKTSTAVDAYIGARMRDGRLALSLSHSDLGRKLGVSFMQKYEIGLNRVSAARLFEICEALNLSLASMFECKL